MALIGDAYDYGSIGGSANQDELTRKSYFDSWYRGEVYQSGFEIGVSSTEINFTTGTLWLLMELNSVTSNHSTINNAIEIHSDGTFHQQLDNFSGFDSYGTGEVISNNRYFNMVCGIAVTQDNVGRMYCMPQNKPVTEHTLIAGAENDNTYVNFFPNNAFSCLLIALPVTSIEFSFNATELFSL